MNASLIRQRFGGPDFLYRADHIEPQHLGSTVHTPEAPLDARPLDGALTIDFYSINQALRGLKPFQRSCGAYLDYCGWRSEEEFARALRESFYDLGLKGQLGNRAGDEAHRGVLLDQRQLTDITGNRLIFDAGYSFATPSAATALEHVDQERMIEKRLNEDPENPLSPVMLKIRVGEASVYLPGPDDDDPLEIRRHGNHLANIKEGQYLLERHSVLKINDMALGSPSPEIPPMTVVWCSQIQ